MSDLLLPANLVDDEFGVTICLEIFNANLIGELHPNQEGIVSVTLLEQGSVNETARGIT